VGTDISGFVEVKREGGWWQAAVNLDPFVSRNYELFGVLFGTRAGDVPGWAPVAVDRGLPGDADGMTVRSRRCLRNAYGDTHVGADEIRRVWGREEFWARLDDPWAEFLTDVLALTTRFDDVRLVVWFDD
jgi:hypothetical protein